MPQSNPIIITFDDQTTDDDEQQQTVKKTNESTYFVPDEERQAIKRLQQLQEEVIRRTNAIELTTKTTAQKVQTPPPPPSVETVQEAIPSTDELSALFEKRYEALCIIFECIEEYSVQRELPRIGDELAHTATRFIFTLIFGRYSHN